MVSFRNITAIAAITIPLADAAPITINSNEPTNDINCMALDCTKPIKTEDHVGVMTAPHTLPNTEVDLAASRTILETATAVNEHKLPKRTYDPDNPEQNDDNDDKYDDSIGSGWEDWDPVERFCAIELFKLSFAERMRRNDAIPFSLSSDLWEERLSAPKMQPLLAKRKYETFAEWVARDDNDPNFAAVLYNVVCDLEAEGVYKLIETCNDEEKRYSYKTPGTR